MTRVRVGVCADFREEGWPSMDRVADRLLSVLASEHRAAIEASNICPPFKRRALALSHGRLAANVDRGLNRLVDYPRHAALAASSYDVFHIVDHSYSQLVHRLPAERTVVTCHDLDTFRSVLQPAADPRTPLFRGMTRHILAGLRRASIVTCDTVSVRDELVALGVLPAARVVVAPVGVGDDFSPDADHAADREAARLVAAESGALEILHVGSPAPRKRLDIVLRSVAEVARALAPATVRLVRVGGPFTAGQTTLARDLGIQARISQLPVLDDRTLAAVYRRAAAVLLPSDREGFGLPVIEALACGAPVIASDLPVLREVGGSTVEYCRPGDARAWASTTIALLGEQSAHQEQALARRESGIAWARRFTWTRFASQLADIYLELAGVRHAVPASPEACRA